MSGGSGAPHRVTILVIVAPAATLLTLHILQDRHSATLIAELDAAAAEFASKARIRCGGASKVGNIAARDGDHLLSTRLLHPEKHLPVDAGPPEVRTSRAG